MLGSLLNAMCRSRRVPAKGFKVLSSKQTGSKFYKGKGAMKTGVHTRYGKFLVLPSMLPQYVVPDLSGFELKPYVARYEPKEFMEKQKELQARLQEHKQAESREQKRNAKQADIIMQLKQKEREDRRQQMEREWWLLRREQQQQQLPQQQQQQEQQRQQQRQSSSDSSSNSSVSRNGGLR